jgi:hypothetical protein
MTDDLIKRLRSFGEQGYPIAYQSADALEAQAKRIEDLDADGHYWCQLASKWQARAEKAGADLAAARSCINVLVGKFGKEAEKEYPEHATAIAAAQGEKSTRRIPGAQRTMADVETEKPKSDVCPTCGISGDHACGTVGCPDGTGIAVAILAALDKAGLVVVPREPTEEMVSANHCECGNSLERDQWKQAAEQNMIDYQEMYRERDEARDAVKRLAVALKDMTTTPTCSDARDAGLRAIADPAVLHIVEDDR